MRSIFGLCFRVGVCLFFLFSSAPLGVFGSESPQISQYAEPAEPNQGLLIAGLIKFLADGDSTWLKTSTQLELGPEDDDVRDRVTSSMPELAPYLQKVVDVLEEYKVTRFDGNLVMDATIPESGLRFDLQKEIEAKKGQPYAVVLSPKMHIEVSMDEESIRVTSIEGFSASIKLPMMPDSIAPYGIILDTRTQILSIYAKAMGGILNVVASVDIRARNYRGIDWWKTIKKNIPFNGSPR